VDDTQSGRGSPRKIEVSERFEKVLSIVLGEEVGVDNDLLLCFFDFERPEMSRLEEISHLLQNLRMIVMIFKEHGFLVR
jgi:hypothetical protein